MAMNRSVNFFFDSIIVGLFNMFLTYLKLLSKSSTRRFSKTKRHNYVISVFVYTLCLSISPIYALDANKECHSWDEIGRMVKTEDQRIIITAEDKNSGVGVFLYQSIKDMSGYILFGDAKFGEKNTCAYVKFRFSSTKIFNPNRANVDPSAKNPDVEKDLTEALCNTPMCGFINTQIDYLHDKYRSDVYFQGVFSADDGRKYVLTVVGQHNESMNNGNMLLSDYVTGMSRPLSYQLLRIAFTEKGLEYLKLEEDGCDKDSSNARCKVRDPKK